MGTIAAAEYFRKKNPVKSRKWLIRTAWLFSTSAIAFGSVMASSLIYGTDSNLNSSTGLRLAWFVLLTITFAATIFLGGTMLYCFVRFVDSGFDTLNAAIDLSSEILDWLLSSLMGSGKQKPAGLNTEKLFDEIEKADPANWWKYPNDDQGNNNGRRRQRPPQDGEEGGDTLSRN
jgi:hypothetical protein